MKKIVFCLLIGCSFYTQSSIASLTDEHENEKKERMKIYEMIYNQALESASTPDYSNYTHFQQDVAPFKDSSGQKVYGE